MFCLFAVLPCGVTASSASFPIVLSKDANTRVVCLFVKRI